MQLLTILALTFILYLIWKYWTLLVGAGYDPTPMSRVYKMLDLAQVDEQDVVYDLGSGDGRIVLTAARRFGARAVGIEVDPFRFAFSWFLILLSGQRKRIELKFGNLFRKNITEATVVTIFLYRPANNKLKEKFVHELKPGTRIVSYIWPLDDWECENALPEERIYLYVIGDAEDKAIEGNSRQKMA